MSEQVIVHSTSGQTYYFAADSWNWREVGGVLMLQVFSRLSPVAEFSLERVEAINHRQPVRDGELVPA